jgi:hypothetical protein
MDGLNLARLLRRFPRIQCSVLAAEEGLEACGEEYVTYLKKKLAYEIADFLCINRPELIEETSREGHMREYRIEVHALSTDFLRSLLDEAYRMGRIDTLELLKGRLS